MIKKIDLAPLTSASLAAIERDARTMRTNLKAGDGIDRVSQFAIIGGGLDAR